VECECSCCDDKKLFFVQQDNVYTKIQQTISSCSIVAEALHPTPPSHCTHPQLSVELEALRCESFSSSCEVFLQFSEGLRTLPEYEEVVADAA